MATYFKLDIGAIVLMLVMSVFVPGTALGLPFNYSETFEGTPVAGIPAGWTRTTAGGGTIGASNARSFGVGNTSMYMKSIANGDRADTVGPAATFVNLDYTKAYSIDFDFNYDNTLDPASFHWIEVMAMNAAAGGPNHIGLFLDQPADPGVNGNDSLIYRTPVPANIIVAGLKEDNWYHLAIGANPGAGTYNLTITSQPGTYEIYDPTIPGWVNQVVTNNIPFIGAGQANAFFPFRFGDRNDESGQFFDHGEAYWDNISIQGTWVPEPATLAVLLAGGLLVLCRRARKA